LSINKELAYKKSINSTNVAELKIFGAVEVVAVMRLSCSQDIVAYLPRAGAVETQKPRNASNNTSTSVYCPLLGNKQRNNEFAAVSAAIVSMQ
jgi:hypothetical protein